MVAKRRRRFADETTVQAGSYSGYGMQTRKASIKETGEELSQSEWERFDAAVAAARIERRSEGRAGVEPMRRRKAVDRPADYEESAPLRP